MRTILLGMTVVAVSGCNLRPLDSNDPDGGACLASTTQPGGSGAVTGSFTAGAAYESSAHQLDPDSGVVIGAQLRVTLLETATPCHGEPDGGAGRFVYLTLVNPNGDRVPAGTYAYNAPDASVAGHFWGFAQLDAGAQYIRAGAVQLSRVDACSAAGSFDVELEERDGGRSPLAGTFSSVYCR